MVDANRDYSELLPAEIWDHILAFLAASSATTADIRHIALTSRRLHELTVPRHLYAHIIASLGSADLWSTLAATPALAAHTHTLTLRALPTARFLATAANALAAEEGIVEFNFLECTWRLGVRVRDAFRGALARMVHLRWLRIEVIPATEAAAGAYAAQRFNTGLGQVFWSELVRLEPRVVTMRKELLWEGSTELYDYIWRGNTWKSFTEVHLHLSVFTDLPNVCTDD